MTSSRIYMSSLYDYFQLEELLDLAVIAEKWPTGCGTLFYPLVYPSASALLPVSTIILTAPFHSALIAEYFLGRIFDIFLWDWYGEKKESQIAKSLWTFRSVSTAASTPLVVGQSPQNRNCEHKFRYVNQIFYWIETWTTNESDMEFESVQHSWRH